MDRPECIPASWVAACLLCHLQATEINCFKVDELIAQNASLKQAEYEIYGYVLFWTISLIKHSCNPSAFVIISTGVVGDLLTLRPLAVGSEISIAYGSTYFDQPVPLRRRTLKSKYCFNCNCEACNNNWTYHEDKIVKLICPDCQNMFIATDSSLLNMLINMRLKVLQGNVSGVFTKDKSVLREWQGNLGYFENLHRGLKSCPISYLTASTHSKIVEEFLQIFILVQMPFLDGGALAFLIIQCVYI